MRSRRCLAWAVGAILALGLAACGGDDAETNNDLDPDTGTQSDADVGTDADDGGQSDGGDPDANDGGENDGGDGGENDGGSDDLEPDPDSAAQIADVAGGEAGPIEQVAVTYTRDEIGNDLAGFFIQATPEGPALFVSLGEDADDIPVAVGDIISLEATEVNTEAAGRSEITAFDNLEVLDSGYDVTELVQEVSEADDVVSNLDGYSQELIKVDVELAGGFGFAGSGHVSAPITTSGIVEANNFELRVADGIDTALDLAQDCVIAVGPSPLWRYQDTAQVSAWTLDDIVGGYCPNATVVDSALGTEETEVTLEFSRLLDEDSIDSSGDQFTIEPELEVTSASVDGNVVTLTTAAQEAGAEYELSIDTSVTDRLDMELEEENATTTFTGYQQPAEVVINELNGNIDGYCHLLELRVTQGGLLDGVKLFERTSDVLTFEGGFQVEADDLIVVHFRSGDESCNPDGASHEVTAMDEEAAADFGGNFDNAWDWWIEEGTLTNTNNVLRVENAVGDILDAVFVSNSTGDCTDYSAAGSTESAASVVADAGQWETADGDVPEGGFVDETFCEHAVSGLADTGQDRAGASIQRTGDTDTNTKDDWTDETASSWGDLNEGQSAQ